MSENSRPLWVFNSANTFAGNPKWLFLHVAKFRQDIDAHWLCDSMATVRKIRKLGFSASTFESAAGQRAQHRASVFVVDQVKERIPALLEDALLLNLWHGVGVKAIERAKGVGYANWRIAMKYIRNNQHFRNQQLFLVSSPLMEEHFREHVSLPESDVIRAGYPQNVYRTAHGAFSSYDHNVRYRKGLTPDARIAVYSPTWRPGQSVGFLREAFPDVGALIEVLEKENTLLIVKMHPRLSEDPDFVRMKSHYASCKNLLFWDNADDIYEMFGDIDLAIVDYSSILYDMLAAGVTRVIRYVFDAERFEESIRPDFSYDELSCGVKATSFEDLLAALQTDPVVDADERQKLISLFWDYSTPDSLERIVDAALSFVPRNVELPTLYSFDIFDTVIHRRGVQPNSVFHLLRQKMRSSDLPFPQALTNRFPVIRMEAETSARIHYRRQEARHVTGELEIQLSDVYERIAGLYGLSPDLVEVLSGWEVEAEIESCIPDVATVEEIRQLLADGQEVVLISDMYLPKGVITEMLAKADPMLASLPLYLSSDQKVQKSTGNLYLRVYEDLKYDYKEWIHTGDNPHADIKVAERLGITTRARETPRLSGYEAAAARFGESYDMYLVASMMHEVATDPNIADVERFAYSYVAPYLVPYVDWLVSDALERGIECLYFISRDGHHLKRICDVLIETRGLSLKTRYIYGSRTAWRLASQIDELDDDTFRVHGSFSGVTTPQALFDVARMDRETFLSFFPEFSEMLEESMLTAEVMAEIRNTLELSESFRRHLLARGAEDRELATRYLAQEIDPTENFAFVEYWGRGYTQDCLARLLTATFGREIETKMYYARSINPSAGLSTRYNFTAANFNFLAIEAIFANLPFGTVEGYAEDGDRIVPIAKARDNDVRLHDALDVQLVEFARKYGSQDFFDRPLANQDLFRFGFFYYRTRPTDPMFVKYLAPLKDAVGLGSEEIEFAPAFTLKSVVPILKGKAIEDMTRSKELSLARTSPVLKTARDGARKFVPKSLRHLLIRVARSLVKFFAAIAKTSKRLVPMDFAKDSPAVAGLDRDPRVAGSGSIT
ncbi:hypothetical protein ESZ53_05785 [Salinibacterium sp. UTAS2018]|uniref:CDP-glycerol glycerophosphotransferase family protein n=1 Tax=Salinibacterium sp. UTAS2018 TaxID=2508880 RepID=UPI00100965A0|nr:CDP-glycerol glycerophosphotransferase family protein [Salinibacterium sp. UTAS2018]QAV69986.1 hypothetical protein ESZ53_05785 [Salinibacterium sp. UTAS2018]